MLAFYLTFFLASLVAFYLEFYSGILSDIHSDILSGIYSDILSYILSGILSGMCSDILSAILSGILSGVHSGILCGIYSDILSGIVSGVHSGNLSDMCPDPRPLDSLLSTNDVAPGPGPVHSTPSSGCGTGWHWAWVPGSRATPHCDLELAVEVRQCQTEIWSSQLRSGRRKEGRKKEAGGRGGASDSRKIQRPSPGRWGMIDYFQLVHVITPCQTNATQVCCFQNHSHAISTSAFKGH